MTERDPMLRRVERHAIVACAVMTAAAAALTRGRLPAALGVLGGGALVWISYRGIKAGIDAVVQVAVPAATPAGGNAGDSREPEGASEASGGEGPASGGAGRVRIAFGLVKFFTRYGILAAVAYVIMARLRLPPLAVFAGASSLVVAIAIEAVQQMIGGPHDRTGTD